MSEAGRATRRSRVGRTGARFPAFVDFEDPDADRSAADRSSADRSGATPMADAAAGDDPSTAAPVVEAEHTMVGRTGARFNSRARRDRRAADRAPTRVDGGSGRDLAAPPGRHAVPVDDAPTRPIFIPAQAQAEPGPHDRTWVRPYVRTRGRTRSRTTLAVETLVSLRSPGPEVTDPEHVAIAEVCVEPRSVAEVAARVGVPLGVARVLIDDMVAAELLVVHDLAVSSTGAPELSVMQRILDGLHRL